MRRVRAGAAEGLAEGGDGVAPSRDVDPHRNDAAQAVAPRARDAPRASTSNANPNATCHVMRASSATSSPRLRAVDGRLVADEGEQAVIARVREARARGLTVRAIAEELAAAGIVSRKGKALAVSAVGELVASHA